jgi:phosphatidylglycerol:prolipoprotein diacylglycerol transferase
VNLPRYPTQLFEAFFEGVFLWLICWSVRNKKPFKGFIFALYLFGYGLIRFIIEYFREADSDLGYRIEFAPTGLDIAYSHPLTSFSTGQIFSAGMMVLAIVMAVFASRMPDRKPVIIFPRNAGNAFVAAGKDADEKKAARNTRRKLRKKLR